MRSILHQLILEPELAAADNYVFLTPAPRRHLQIARKSALRNRILKRVIGNRETEIEKVIQWIDPVYGLPCKAKMDITYRDHRSQHIIELKSTGEKRTGLLFWLLVRNDRWDVDCAKSGEGDLWDE